MRKIILTTLILFPFFLTHGQKLQFGLKISPEIVWVKSDNILIVKNNSVGLGFSYGLVADYNIRDNYGLNIEFIHNMLNFKTLHKDTLINEEINKKWNQGYVEIPVALKMKTNEINSIIYFGKIGISPMINTSAKIGADNIKEKINFFNASFIVGGGIHYALGGRTMALAGITFHNGLLRTNSSKVNIFTNNNSKDVQLKPSYVCIDLGILF